MSIDKKSLCPNCGAPLSGLEIKCPECGYVLISENTASQNTTESILSLQNKLIEVDKIYKIGSSSKRKASIIQSFPIPNTVESLIRLLHFSFSNFEAAKESGDKKLSMAWLGKASESYRRLSAYKENQQVLRTLEQYKILDDKSAFSILSGSRQRNRLILVAALLLTALAGTFVLCFDWGGYLIRRGKIDVVVDYYNSHNKRQKALDLLLKNGRFEESAQQLFLSGRQVEAVSVLAQNGLIKQALIMTAKTNDPDSIHRCVDEISKHAFISSRTKYYLDRDLIVYDDHNTVVYNGDGTKYKEVYSPSDSSVLWTDCLDIARDMNRPAPAVFLYSPFLNFYYQTDFRVIPSRPEISMNSMNKIERVTFGPNTLMDLLKSDADSLSDLRSQGSAVYMFNRNYSQIFGETLLFNGSPAVSVEYTYYSGTDLLQSVNCNYLIDKAPNYETARILTILQAKGRPYSYRDEYHYTDGKLMEIKRTWPYMEDLEYEKLAYEYYGNLRIQTDSIKQYGADWKADDFRFIDLFCDGKIIEVFSLSMQNGDGVRDSRRLYGSPEHGLEVEFPSNNENRATGEADAHEVKADARPSNSTGNASGPLSGYSDPQKEIVTIGDISVRAPNVEQVDEQFNATFTIKGKATDIFFSPPAGIDLVWGPQKGVSSQNVNGKLETTTSYTYILVARKSGKYTLSAQMKVEGQTVQCPKKYIDITE